MRLPRVPRTAAAEVIHVMGHDLARCAGVLHGAASVTLSSTRPPPKVGHRLVPLLSRAIVQAWGYAQAFPESAALAVVAAPMICRAMISPIAAQYLQPRPPHDAFREALEAMGAVKEM